MEIKELWNKLTPDVQDFITSKFKDEIVKQLEKYKKIRRLKMENNLIPFNFNENQVRTLTKEDNSIWFIAKDVCNVLDISNNRDAISKLDKGEKGVIKVDTLRGNQDMSIISESGLYSLIFASRKEQAKKFQKWITSDVIPSIRKTGSYSLDIPKTLPEALRAYANALDEKNKLLIENKEMLPKVEMYENFMIATNSQAVGEVAKVLGTGRNKLFKFLRDNKLLMSNNLPYQQFLDSGLFEVKESLLIMNGKVMKTGQTFITSKGFEYISKFINK